MNYPQNTTSASVKVIPEFSNTKSGKGALLEGLNGTLGKANTLLGLGKRGTPRIIELVSKAKILGLVRYGSHTLVVYDGDLVSPSIFSADNFQNSAFSLMEVANPQVHVIMFRGSALLARMRIAVPTYCYSHPRSSRFVASIQAPSFK